MLDAPQDTLDLAHADIGIHPRERRGLTQSPIGLLQPRGRPVRIAKHANSGCGYARQAEQPVRLPRSQPLLLFSARKVRLGSESGAESASADRPSKSRTDSRAA